MSNASIHVCFGDIHVGCQFAIMPAGGAHIDGGGLVRPSDLQLKIMGHWRRAWGRWLPEIVGDQRYDLFNLGDTIDGVHHQGVTQSSHNLKDQENAAVKLLGPIVKACKVRGGHYYHIRGTEAHGGKSGQHEERIAERLGATPNRAGQYARDELWKWIGSPKRAFLGHYSHHIGTSVASQYESTAPMREIVRAFTEAARWDQQIPDFLVRGHRHRHMVLPVSGRKHGKRRRRLLVITPAWQAYTPLVHRLSGATQAPAQFGLVAIILDKRGELYTRDWTYEVERPEPE